ncbi:RNA polymerase subunit AC19, partial [Tilletia horrida]
ENVEFCGYSLPHPSELKCHLRVQMYNKANAVTALQQALMRLEQLFEDIKDAYQNNLAGEEFERFEEPKRDFESIRLRQEANGTAPAATSSRR